MGEGFDAIVGRLILMYLGDPAAALRAFARRLRPGGGVAFQDYAIRVVWPPDSALWRQVAGWIEAVGRRAGIELEMGYKLRRAFLDAGLPEPWLRLDACIGGGPDFDGSEEVAGVLRSMLPLILKFGIATAEEVGIDILEDRLRAELATGGVAKMPDLVGAWARVPPTATRVIEAALADLPAPCPDVPDQRGG